MVNHIDATDTAAISCHDRVCRQHTTIIYRNFSTGSTNSIARNVDLCISAAN